MLFESDIKLRIYQKKSNSFKLQAIIIYIKIPTYLLSKVVKLKLNDTRYELSYKNEQTLLIYISILPDKSYTRNVYSVIKLQKTYKYINI